VYQVGNQPRLFYDARSTNHQDFIQSDLGSFCLGVKRSEPDGSNTPLTYAQI